MDLVYKDESYRIIGACFEVYKEMGCGFHEDIYQECLELEMTAQAIPFRPQTELQLVYKGRKLKHTYVPDFLCFSKIVLEIKAVSELTALNRAQLHNYLKATGHKLGLLVNFGHYPKLESERVVH
jgi:GxxExxY protein